MSKANDSVEKIHAWSRLLPFWNGLGFVIIAISIWLAFARGRLELSWTSVALPALFTIWHAGAWRLDQRARDDQVAIRAAYIFIGLLIWTALARLDPQFMLLLAVLYPRIFSSLPISWAAAAALALMGLWLYAIMGYGSRSPMTTIVIGGVMTASAIGLGLFIHAIIKQSIERHALLEALEKTRGELARSERRAGVLDERQRLAREIHDTVAQSYTGIVTHLEAAEAALDGDLSQASLHLDQARAMARSGLDETRQLVWALRPDLAPGEPLERALGRMAAEWSRRQDTATTFTVSGEPRPLPAEIAAALPNMLREALNNVRKHARATQVDVTLSFFENRVALDVHDNGVGFAPPSADGQSAGFGLRSLRDQAARLGGELALESEPGEGATVAVGLPLAGTEARS